MWLEVTEYGGKTILINTDHYRLARPYYPNDGSAAGTILYGAYSHSDVRFQTPLAEFWSNVRYAASLT